MKLFLATKNKNKIIEITELLQHLDIEILSANEVKGVPDVVEDLDTIEGNAVKKAMETANHTGYICLADDTGFFVEALNGNPGVKAARYAGENASYSDNREKMLKEMVGKTNRKAYFKTAVVLAKPGEIIATVTGKVEGTITEMELGSDGFGYDPIFRADETGRTFGEMSSLEKHKISHRARALSKALIYITQLIKSYKES